MDAEKAAIRKFMRGQRRLVTSEERLAHSRRICALLADAAKDASTVAVYLATKDEIPLDPLISYLRSRGARICAPFWDASKSDYGISIYCDEARLEPAAFGILEPRPISEIDPREVDAWIVPGLAFTISGARLGYGGGFYDRLLSRARPNALKLSPAYPFQIVETLPKMAHDINVDRVVT